MGLKIVCSGYLLRYPLGGFSFHHLQYVLGFHRLGHDVTYFEDFGWPDSCYDPREGVMTSSPLYGAAYVDRLMRPNGLGERWCYLAEDGRTLGMPRQALADALRECDVYFNLSNINWIDELEHCRRRVLIDTDPVFTQIDGHGMGEMVERHHTLFTYGENVHRDGCTMPTRARRWLPTRQPVLLDLWSPDSGNPSAPISTVMNWTAYGAHDHEGTTYGQKDIEFKPFVGLPREQRLKLTLAVVAPVEVMLLLKENGWDLVNPSQVTRDPQAYQDFIRSSKAEFCVAKHAYVLTRCGWFSDRSTGYLASGRPVVVQDTGFSRFLPCGKGLLAFRTPEEAVAALRKLDDDYAGHCRAARAVVAEHFAAEHVLADLLERSL
jgi:hypothetical protein